ncbi:hypothetical protein [Palaeococcus sp. (in: euryarchaeotes)]
MKNKLMLLALFMLIGVLNIPQARGEPVLTLHPQEQVFNAYPGDSVDVYFNLTNLGNESAKNVFVIIDNLPQGATYTQEVIQELAPNQTHEGHIQIILNSIRAGTYKLKLVAKIKDSPIIVRVPLTLRVLTKIDYSLKIDAQEKYIYGNDVSISCEIRSKSNGVLMGTVKIELYKGNELIKAISESTYINPYDKKTYTLILPRPDVGGYLAIMKTKFNGVEKTESKEFKVYQRKLTYTAGFENGVITVQVKDEEGKGVSGIPVQINSLSLKTDSLGVVQIEAKEPGTYKIKLNLDGRLVETFVEVKKLFLDYSVKNESLIVYVRDSSGKGIPNVSVSIEGITGKEYQITDAEGKVKVDLTKIGFGLVKLKAESSKYIGDEKSITIEKPAPPVTTTTTTTVTTVTQTNTTTTPMAKPPKNYGNLPIILLLSALLFGGSSYVAFFRPLVFEEQLDKYYFIKVKAPRLRSLENYTIERIVNAVDVRATKGKARIEGNRVIWEVEHLEPGEEAFLQVIL